LLTDRQTNKQTNERGQTHLPPSLSEVIIIIIIIIKPRLKIIIIIIIWMCN